jgi:hypothetical protein
MLLSSFFRPEVGVRFSARVGVLALAASALVSCSTDTEAVPDQSLAYYPLATGSYRVYDVLDSTYRDYKATVSHYQLKEEVTSATEPDAAGELVYRVLRSRRASSAESWRVDSVVTVSANLRRVLELRNNVRRVELVFPVAEDKQWDANAFNIFTQLDSADQANHKFHQLNRAYSRVGAPLTLQRAGQTFTYPATITTTNDLSPSPYKTGITNISYTVVRSVFAEGVGPVYRARRFYDYCKPGDCRPGVIYFGYSHSEVLIEHGP